MLSHMLRAASGPARLVFVGGAVASSTAGTNFTVSLTALTGGLASSPSQNDIVIIASEVGDDAACDAIGYTQIALVSTLISTLYVGYKFMGATPDTTATITGSGTSAQGAAVVAYVWRGANLTTPMDVTATTSSSTTTAIADPPSITPITRGAIVIAAGGAGHTAGAVNFTATGLSNFRSTNANVSGTPSYDATVGMGWTPWYSGAYNPSAFTFGAADSTSYMSCGVTLALRPA